MNAHTSACNLDAIISSFIWLRSFSDFPNSIPEKNLSVEEGKQHRAWKQSLHTQTSDTCPLPALHPLRQPQCLGPCVQQPETNVSLWKPLETLVLLCLLSSCVTYWSCQSELSSLWLEFWGILQWDGLLVPHYLPTQVHSLHPQGVTSKTWAQLEAPVIFLV